MKTVTAALFSLVTLASPSAFAQTVASSFGGLSVGLNANFNQSAVEVTGPGGAGLGKVNASDQNFSIQMAKGIAFGSNGVANLGWSAVLGDVNAGELGTLKFKANANYALYGELGYALNTRSMAYAKLSLNRLSGQVSGTATGQDASLSADGQGLGFGYRYVLTQGLYVQGEWMQVKYQEVAGPGGLYIKPSSSVAMLGVGFKF